MVGYKQAVKWKLEGKDVFHQGRHMVLNDDCLSMSDIDGPMGKSLDTEDFYYDAWEIYEEKEKEKDSLSDEIIVFDDCPQCNLSMEYVGLPKESVIEFIKDLKEKVLLVAKEFEDMDTRESLFTSGALEAIPHLIDKLAGEKLI